MTRRGRRSWRLSVVGALSKLGSTYRRTYVEKISSNCPADVYTHVSKSAQ